MLWFGKQVKSARDVLVPATLPVPLDPVVFQKKWRTVQAACAEENVPLEIILESLQKKQALFALTFSEATLPALSDATLQVAVETMFSVRKKFPDLIKNIDFSSLVSAIQDLRFGQVALAERLSNFANLLPLPGKKDKAAWRLRRALDDMAAEILHFSSPDQYPLLTHWVWDANTQSGAMREFVKHGDALNKIPFDMRPETFEAVRVWLASQFNEQGYYRDVPFLVDLLLAHAYAEYSYSMSMSLGMAQAEFGSKNHPLDMPLRLLGVGFARPEGKSRLGDADPADSIH
jgi:hypothetical protein